MSRYYRSLIQTAAPPAGLLLDNYTTNLVSVYSMYKRITAYSGPALELRRSSDNATDDFMFDTNGQISGSSMNQANTTSLTTWAGADTIYVVTVYNQAGGTNHYTQSITSRQPALQLASTPTGEASIYWDGTSSVGFYSANTYDFDTNDEVTIINTFARDGAAPSTYHTIFFTGTTGSTSTSITTPYFLNFSLDTANIRNDMPLGGTDLNLSGSVIPNQTMVTNSWRYPASGTAEGYNAYGTASGSAPTSGLMTAYMIIGNFSIRPARGWINDMFMWDSAINTTDMIDIRTALETQYA